MHAGEGKRNPVRACMMDDMAARPNPAAAATAGALPDDIRLAALAGDASAARSGRRGATQQHVFRSAYGFQQLG